MVLSLEAVSYRHYPPNRLRFESGNLLDVWGITQLREQARLWVMTNRVGGLPNIFCLRSPPPSLLNLANPNAASKLACE